MWDRPGSHRRRRTRPAVGACQDEQQDTLPPAGRLVLSPEDDLYAVRANGSARRLIVGAPGAQFDADWSPDGR